MSKLPLEDGGELVFIERWLSPDDARRLFDALIREVPFQQKTILMMGKQVMQPRLVAWFGDPNAYYTYSGVRNDPLPWTPALMELRARVEEAAEHPFNSVLVNLYRDERDSMGFHADKEKELGKNPVIASVSLGESRRFQLRYTGKRKGAVGRDFVLSDGSLLIMRGTTQHHYRHGVPKETASRGPRINLTFRQIMP